MTDLPLTVAIRNQEVPETTLPAQVARHAEPLTRTTAPTFAPVWMEVLTRAVVEGDVRRFAGQSAIFG